MHQAAAICTGQGRAGGAIRSLAEGSICGRDGDWTCGSTSRPQGSRSALDCRVGQDNVFNRARVMARERERRLSPDMHLRVILRPNDIM
eukprot:scaffold196351_cov30-Tisochrysis_lutea.AAC.2